MYENIYVCMHVWEGVCMYVQGFICLFTYEVCEDMSGHGGTAILVYLFTVFTGSSSSKPFKDEIIV